MKKKKTSKFNSLNQIFFNEKKTGYNHKNISGISLNYTMYAKPLSNELAGLKSSNFVINVTTEPLEVHVILMAGGRGERFWPRSRVSRPKQSLNIGSTQPLLVESVERLLYLIPEKNIVVSTGKHLEGSFRDILKNYTLDWIIEPAQRDTAAAIGYAITYIRSKVKSNFIAVILGSDYRITDPSLFRIHLKKAIELANQNYIVTLGIKPNRAATGYGYIRKGDIVDNNGISSFRAKEFKEKPDRKTAEGYLSTGEYLWNSGMFICPADVMMAEIKKFVPEHYEGFERIVSQQFDPWVTSKVFEQFQKISIDYAVMEKTEHLVVLESTFDWDDLGDWLAMDRLIPHDARENAIEALWIGMDTDECIILGHENSHKKLIATLGIEDLIIVDTDDVIFISHKDHVHKIKQFVQHIGTHKKLKEFL